MVGGSAISMCTFRQHNVKGYCSRTESREDGRGGETGLDELAGELIDEIRSGCLSCTSRARKYSRVERGAQSTRQKVVR